MPRGSTKALPGRRDDAEGAEVAGDRPSGLYQSPMRRGGLDQVGNTMTSRFWLFMLSIRRCTNEKSFQVNKKRP